ncbi:MAG: hypothetical protein ACOC5S_02385 [Acidobacteriota bacterium]
MRKLPSFFCAAVILSIFTFAGWGELFYGSVTGDKKKKEEPENIIIKIYEEVKEMGLREGEDFIKREFHFDLDGRRANREEHILVFSYSSNRQQILSIQVTYYEDENNQNYQGRAQVIKDINCSIKDENVQIDESDYSQEQIEKVLPQILEGIKKEKEFLKLVRKSG